MRWRSNRHIKEFLFSSKNKRQIQKKDREEQRSRLKKMKESDRMTVKVGSRQKHRIQKSTGNTHSKSGRKGATDLDSLISRVSRIVVEKITWWTKEKK
jgi:hypothetical protein